MPPGEGRERTYSVQGVEGKGPHDDQALIIHVGIDGDVRDRGDSLSTKVLAQKIEDETMNTGGDHPAAMEMLRRNLRAASYAFGGFNTFGIQRVFAAVDTDNGGYIELDVRRPPLAPRAQRRRYCLTKSHPLLLCCAVAAVRCGSLSFAVGAPAAGISSLCPQHREAERRGDG